MDSLEWRVMENYKLSNMPNKKRNSLKVLVKTKLLVKPLKSMAMASKNSSNTPNKRRNSLKVLVKTKLLVKTLKSMVMESKKNSAMHKQKIKMKMMIFLWLKLLERKWLLNLLVLKVPLFQILNLIRSAEIIIQLLELKT